MWIAWLIIHDQGVQGDNASFDPLSDGPEVTCKCVAALAPHQQNKAGQLGQFIHHMIDPDSKSSMLWWESNPLPIPFLAWSSLPPLLPITSSSGFGNMTANIKESTHDIEQLIIQVSVIIFVNI
jgi:hypothetical protein